MNRLKLTQNALFIESDHLESTYISSNIVINIEDPWYVSYFKEFATGLRSEWILTEVPISVSQLHF